MRRFEELGAGPSLLAALASSAALLEAATGDGCTGGACARAPLEEVLRVAAQALAACGDDGADNGSNDSAAHANGGDGNHSGADAASRQPPETRLGLSDGAVPNPVAAGEGAGGDAASEAAAACEAAVARCLCTHFQVDSVACLGHGPLRRLLQQVRHRGVASFLTPVWPTAVLATTRHGDASVAAGAGSAAAGASALAAVDVGIGVMTGAGSYSFSAVGAAGAVDRAAALRCLAAAPELADLQLWSQWDAVFRPCLGPLDAFLQTPEVRTLLLKHPVSCARACACACSCWCACACLPSGAYLVDRMPFQAFLESSWMF